MADELVTVPQDLTLLSDVDLEDLLARAVSEFDRLQSEEVSPEAVQYQIKLTADIDRMRAEVATREVRARLTAEQDRARMVQERDTLQARVHGRTDANGEEHPPNLGAPVDVQGIAEAAARGATAALVAVIGQRGGARLDQASVTSRATASLSEARRHAPDINPPTRRLAVTAGVDIPGVARGSEVASLDDLVSAFQRAAKGLPVTRDGTGREALVATIRNEYEHVVDDRTSPAQVEDLINHLTRSDKMESLVAGGGWCAPSEIRYDFFNVAGVDGLVDLPTVGISRGGIRHPVSPSIADAFGATGLAPFAVPFTEGSNPWLWTETDDVAAATGLPTKPCIRVPCPTFTEKRLECYGICLTAGNLTDDAYPEATANTLRLLLTAWQHAQNARIISQMVALSEACVTGGGAGAPVYQTVLNGLDMFATDYRAKFAIPRNVVLEVVAPYWVLDCIVADLAWREGGGADLLSVTEAQINGYFADRNVRVQWVNDWQVRATGQFGHVDETKVTWPTSAQFLLYAAGTFLKGNGLTLDLGVIRDSTLNATNDHTAAWSEECHLVTKIGHESRCYTLTFCVDGAVGAGFYAAGSPTCRV